MDQQFKIVFTGKFQEGTDLTAFIEQFSQRFKVSTEKASKLTQANRRMVMKKGLDRETADKHRKVLEALGMIIELEEMTPPAVFGSSEETADPPVASTYAPPQAAVFEERDETEEPSTSNPYTAPQATLVDTPEEGEMNGPVSVSAGQGWAWIKRGYWHFRQNPGPWILAIVLWFVITIIGSIIPFISLALNIAYPVFLAGFVLGAHEQDQGGDFTVKHLFAGFSNSVGQLMLLGLLYLVGFFAAMMIGLMAAGGSMAMLGVMTGIEEDPAAIQAAMADPMVIILPVLIMLLLTFPLMMAYFYAPALIALNNFSAIQAMKESFFGCLKNILPLTVYGLLAILLMIVAMIPVGLGLLVLMPVMTAAVYASYRDIYYA